MNYVPLADRVTVKESQPHQVSPGGIAIPDVAQRNKHLAFGTVLACGAGRVNAEGRTVPLTVKPGDVVAYPRKLGAVIPLMHADGSEEDVVLLREGEIIAIVEGLPVSTSLRGVDGRILSMVPTSRGLPDVVYSNRDELEHAEFNGMDTEHPPEEFGPGETP